MQFYERTLDLKDINRKSLFLFGPRQTGKSSLLKYLFPYSPYFNLLEASLYLKLQQNPSLIKEMVLALDDGHGPIIIDEIQKLPILLDEVHNLIENYQKIFILTGSSARKLKKDGANMLGGRALEKKLFPLTTFEIKDFDLDRIINWGSLPPIYTSSDPEEDLFGYIGTYLKEEIMQEGLVRGLAPFSSFLDKAALNNTELINFSNIASDIGLSANTIREYYQILSDTLIGTLLLPYSKNLKRKSVSKAKFYFFDVGVSNILAKRFTIKPGSELYGKCFEHFIFTELTAYLHYSKDRRALTFWRTQKGLEVDFVIGDNVAIEVKGSNNIQPKHYLGLKALAEELELSFKIIISLETVKRKTKEGILIYPVKDFLIDLWNHKFSFN